MTAQATATRPGRDPAGPAPGARATGPRRPTGRPVPGVPASSRRSWRPLLAAALLWALWAVCVLALRNVFVGAAWTGRALVLAAVVLLGAGALRSVRPRSGMLAWLLGALGGASLIGWWGLADGRLAAWLSGPQEALQQTWLDVSAGVPPMELSGPLLDVVLAAWCAGLLLSSLLFARFGLLLASGLPPALLMLLPVTVTSLRVSPPLMLAAGALLLLLLWLEAPPAAGRWRGIVAAGLALALAAGILAVLPPSRDRVWNANAVSVGPVSASVPDVTIALGEDLRSRSGTVAFDYRVDGRAVPVRFTLAVLRDFERGAWQPEDALDPFGAAVDEARSGAGAADGEDPARSGPSVTVRSQGLVSSWLPLPQTVQRVEAEDGGFDPGRWNWVTGTATARSGTALTRPGDVYRAAMDADAFGSMRVAERFTAEQLAGFDPGPYTELPAGVPAAIAEAAQEATASVDADLELLRANPDGAMHFTSGTVVPSGLGEAATRELLTAAALEEWFRSGAFAYDESAPYEPGLDPDDPYAVMEAFLAQRSGYCVHYASTFAVMARSLGLPTRVAVGYVSRPAEDARWTPVRARELHAWPEVLVSGIGWVAFEPTPGGAGFRAETGRSSAPASASAGEQPSPLQAPDTPIESEQPQDPALPDAAEPGAAAETPPGDAAATDPAVPAPLTALLWTLATLLLLLGIAPGLRALRRERRLRLAGRGTDPASQAWAEFVDTAVDLGLHRPGAGRARARTPEALVEHLAGRGLLDAAGAEAAGALARSVVAERFSGTASTAPSLAEARIALRSLRLAAPSRARWRAAILPRSVLGRHPRPSPPAALRRGRTGDTPERAAHTLETT